MRTSSGGIARQVYRVLLRFYPRAFRAKHGEDMEETFLTLLEWESRRRGLVGKMDAWVSGGLDALSGGVRRRFRRRPEPAGAGRPEHDPTRSKGVVEMLGALMGDIRMTIRGLVRRPLFAITVILTLAVGIGANASVFTLVNGLLLTPLPYEDPEELVTLWEENAERGWSGVNVSPLNAQDWGERAHTLEELATFYSQELTLTGEGQPALLPVVRVSSNMFDLLGRTPMLGRGFTKEEMGVGRDGVVVLTHGFWQRQFGGDPAILGKTLDLQGNPRAIVGILPAGFRFLDEEPDLFLPLDLVPSDRGRNEHFLKAVGRLSAGSALADARADLDQVALQLQDEYPDTNGSWTVRVSPAREDMLGPTAKPAALALMVAVGFVLLMVCVNVANLALARGEHRTLELAVRMALGAGRGRMIRQLLTESLVLGSLGGGLGLLLANWGYRAVVATLPNHTAPIFQFGLDGSVLAFTVAITLVSVLLFGTVPAFRLSRSGPGALRDGGRSGQSASASRFGSVLVVVQTALALVLLVGGGLLMKMISEMRGQDLGFDPANVITVRVRPPALEYPEAADVEAFWGALEGAVVEAPGVLSVGSTQSHPLMNETWVQTVQIVGQDQERTARLTYASGGLFDALGFHTVRGRPLQAQDDDAHSGAAVVNEAFVQAYMGPETDPLTASLQNPFDTTPPMPIVGVIQDVVEGGVDQEPGPALYLSFSQAPVRRRSLVIRTSVPPAESLEAIREAVWSVDPKLPLDRIETLRSQVDDHIGGFAVTANLMAVFAFLSLILGALGIYGVTAYAASRRTHEIGIRIALGARQSDVIRMVVSQGARKAVLGLALGLILAFLVTGAMGSVLVGIEPRDPSVFLLVTLILAGMSFLALLFPAWRASAVGPLAALDKE